MEIKHRFGTVYHPQGMLERINGNIKTKLAKTIQETELI